MENKQKILEVVQESQLSPEDKKEWKFFLESASGEVANSLAVLLEILPGEIQWFTDILKKKKEAFAILKEDKTKGETLLQEIYEEEKIKLEKLADKQA